MGWDKGRVNGLKSQAGGLNFRIKEVEEMKKIMLLILVTAAILSLALGANFAMGDTSVHVCGQLHEPAAPKLEDVFHQAHELCHEAGVPSASVPV